MRGFWSIVDKSGGENACWPWTGWKDKDGRGRFYLDGKNTISSRAALILARGRPDPETLFALHSCDNPECCNPRHLFWGTQEKNMQDMGRKGRAGIQQHPERYRRARRPDVKYRPVKQPNAPQGIDHRTATRFATEEERELARQALRELEEFRNLVTLVPAPAQNFDGHKIRVMESRNPDWYIEFGADYWRGPRQFQLKRCRVERALERVVSGKVRGNGYEVGLIEWLKKRLKILA